MTLLPLPAFQDNYLWLLHDGQQALVVDPGDPQPVLQALAQARLTLQSILVTHHHRDHTGGLQALVEASSARVIGPARETLPVPFEPVAAGDVFDAVGLRWQVIDVPGHTAGHVAYFCETAQPAPLLFCGDTLFSGGCGRLFEGTPAQMLDSLDRLSALPGETRVCCAHEYTLSNLKFAREVEPENQELLDYQQACQAMRDRGEPTLPSTIGRERAINPFLRTRTADVIRAAQAYNGAPVNDPIGVFAAIRQWKNEFQ